MNETLNNPHRRKKQPLQVRSQLLNAATDAVIEKGIEGLTLDAVAKRAGVSKGGLLHHFPNKKALVDALFENLLNEFDVQIEKNMANDTDLKGRFSRAYLASNSQLYNPKHNHLMAILTLAMTSNADLRQRWLCWNAQHIQTASAEENDIYCILVRLAADGLWLSALTQTPQFTEQEYQQLISALNELTHKTN